MAEDVAQKPANLAGASVCLSLTVEGTPLSDAGSGGMTAQEPLTDWRLVLGPALLVENLLPVRGTFLVWEQPQVGGLRRAAALWVKMQDKGSEGKVYCMRGMQHRAGLFSGSGCCSVGWQVLSQQQLPRYWCSTSRPSHAPHACAPLRMAHEMPSDKADQHPGRSSCRCPRALHATLHTLVTGAEPPAYC